ncbi:MAG TPA: gliding motility-associated C-terminal domain-containing protein [Chitinophagaceae bacterium]
MKTSDGGKTWVNNSDPTWDQSGLSPGTGILNVKYPAVDKMFYLAGITLYRSPDQGTSYTALFAEPSGNASVNGFEQVGDKAFVIAHRFSGVQRTHIYRVNNVLTGPTTVDTYNNFVTGPTGNLAPQLRNIKFANADTGYTCGSRGKVFRTIDGGNTWTDISPDTLVNSNGTATYTALSVVNGRTIYVGGSSRKMFRSTDAGATWTDMTFTVAAVSPLTSFSSIYQILMNDPNNGYAVAGSVLLKTTDAWTTWTYDIAPTGLNTFSGNALALYPKANVPFGSKKLYLVGFQNGTQPNSTNSCHLLEYGNFTITDLATTETITGASCTNPTGGAITIAATGAITPYQYSINGGAYQSSNVFNGLTGGTKTISIKDGSCQVVTKTITVPFTDNLTLSTNNDTIVCAGAPVQMRATSNLAGTNFSWSPAGGLTAANIGNPIATVNNNSAFTVTATLNGCVRTKTVNIGIKPNPVINAGPDQTILMGDEALLQGSGNAAVTITWTPTASVLYGGNSFQAKVKPAATTTYTLTVLNSDGCRSTDDVVVNIVPNCADVKNAFTPNGDGMNDRWIVSSSTACYTKLSVAVYNRYGNEVYKNDNYQNNWDGTYNGKPVADGTYYYVVSFKLINGRTATLKGDVTILR